MGRIGRWAGESACPTELKFQAAGAVAAEPAGGGLLAQINDQRHYQLLDLIADLAVLVILHEDRIVDFPFENLGARGQIFGDRTATQVHDQVEFGAPQMTETFGELIAQVDVFFAHGFEGIGSDSYGGRETGTGGDQDICAIGAGEGFRHLAAAGVADAEKEDAFALIGVRSWSLHNFFRKSAWTRESAVSSGWKVETRWRPCSTRTGSPW